MKICTRCATPLPGTVKFCTHCGTRSGMSTISYSSVSSSPAPSAVVVTPSSANLSGTLTESSGIPSHIAEILAPEPEAPAAATPAPVESAPAVNTSSPMASVLSSSSGLPSHIAEILAPEPEAPATATPAAQTPAAQTPAAQTPAAQTPVAQTPAAQTPAVQTPAAQMPATQTPAAQMPASQTPASQTPSSQNSVTVVPATTPAPSTPPAINRPAVTKTEKTPGKTTGMGVFGIIVFSVVLLVSLVVSYVSLVAASVCGSESGNIKVSIDGYVCTINDFKGMADQFERADTKELVRAIVQNDGAYQMRVGSRIYDVYFDEDTTRMLGELIVYGEGLSEKIDDTVDSAMDFAKNVLLGLFVFAILAAIASAVAMIKCFGKTKTGLIAAAVIMLVAGILMTIVSVMGMSAPGNMFAVFAADDVATVAIFAAGIIDIAGISLLVGGIFSEKKEA